MASKLATLQGEPTGECPKCGAILPMSWVNKVTDGEIKCPGRASWAK